MLADLAKIRDSVQIGATAVIPDDVTRVAHPPRSTIRVRPPSRALRPRSPEPRLAPANPRDVSASVVKPVWNGFSPEPGGDHRDMHRVFTSGRGSRIPRPQPGRRGCPGGRHDAASGRSGSNRAGIRSPNKTMPKNNSATHSCRRLPTTGSRPSSPSSGTFPHCARADVESLHPARSNLVPPRRLPRSAVLEAELSQWKDAKKRDQDLVDAVRIAIKLKKNDLEGVVQGMKTPDAG